MSTTEQSKIEWTHYTFNPWRGCTKVSPGCANCYAEKMSGRNPKALGIWGKDGTRAIAAESYWRGPIKWNEEAKQAGERRRVFCASLADVFESPDTMPAESVKPVRAARLRLFGLIQATPYLDWLLLTKRPELIMPLIEQAALDDRPGDTCEMTNGWLKGWPPENVWLGTSVEDQKRADERIPHLLRCPAAVRFLSCEPLLGPIDLRHVDSGENIDSLYGWYPNRGPEGLNGNRIDWVIIGGESGPGARSMHPDWVRGIRDQCVAAGVPFFFKQWGEWQAISGMANTDHLYVSRRKAEPGQDQSALDESYGRVCTVDTKVIRFDGDLYDVVEDHAFEMIAGHPGYQTFRVGKKAAGRTLDERTWDEMPEGQR